MFADGASPKPWFANDDSTVVDRCGGKVAEFVLRQDAEACVRAVREIDGLRGYGITRPEQLGLLITEVELVVERYEEIPPRVRDRLRTALEALREPPAG